MAVNQATFVTVHTVDESVPLLAFVAEPATFLPLVDLPQFLNRGLPTDASLREVAVDRIGTVAAVHSVARIKVCSTWGEPVL